jgi:Gpi18-like mannosyltransferase
MATADAPPEQTSPVPGVEEQGAGRPALSDRLPRAWMFPLAAFAAVWLLILVTWDGSDAITGHSHPWAWHILIADTGFYRGIAQYGYTGDPARGAFFPLYPLLIHVASYLTGGDYLLAGLITTVACGAASAVAVWALAVRVCDRRVADGAVVLYCFFPGAMTFGILYSEPLGVALAAAALLALLDRRWLLAGIIGALATFERPTLIVLVAVSGVAAIQAIWARREWWSLLAPLLTPIGLLAFFDYLGHHYHNYAYWFWVVNKGWHQHFDWGASTFRMVFWLDPHDRIHQAFVVMLTIMFVAALAGIALMVAARLPLPLILFGVLTILLAITSAGAGPRPRLVWSAFPIFIGAAAKLPRVVYWPVLILSAAGLVLLVGGWRQLFGPKLAP